MDSRSRVNTQGHVIYSSIGDRYIAPEASGKFSLNFVQMFLSIRQCTNHMAQLPRLKVKVTCQGQGYNFEFCVRCIYLWTLWVIIINLIQMFLSVKRCAGPMNWLCRLKVKSHFKDMWFALQFVSAPYLLNLLNDFHLTSTRCSFLWANDSAIQDRGQCFTSRSRELPLNLVSAIYLLSYLLDFH